MGSIAAAIAPAAPAAGAAAAASTPQAQTGQISEPEPVTVDVSLRTDIAQERERAQQPAQGQSQQDEREGAQQR